MIMIDDKDIEVAANLHGFELIASMHGSTLGTPMQCFEEVVDAETDLIENSFITGAKWAIKEFIKGLWHPASEIPSEGKHLILEYSITDTIKDYVSLKRLDNNYIYWDWASYFESANVTRWLYIDDLLPKEESCQKF